MGRLGFIVFAVKMFLNYIRNIFSLGGETEKIMSSNNVSYCGLLRA